MIFGIVSNCWRRQLEAGESLTYLVERAASDGYQAIELRQTCLGNYETAAEKRPIPERLAELPERFPGLRFNVALALPFFSGELTPGDATFDAGKWAAQATAGEFLPHLRMVDPSTTTERLAAVGVDEVAESLVVLTQALAEIDGVLSIENARQPWSLLRAVFERTRSQLGTDGTRLRLCYDPCNLLAAGDEATPRGATASLGRDWLSLVHFKQRREGRSLAVVDDGDLDWREQWRLLRKLHSGGPGLFEIEPSEDVWQRLDESRAYLEGMRDEG